MTKAPKAKRDELATAFRTAARELGCDQSDERFREELHALGNHKPLLAKQIRTRNLEEKHSK
jgi:hypothetical protein